MKLARSFCELTAVACCGRNLPQVFSTRSLLVLFEHEEELCAALLWVHAPKERVSLYVSSVRVREKWDAYIRMRNQVGTKPSSCSTSDSAPVRTKSQHSGQGRRSSAGNGAARMAHLAALGDLLRPGLSMNSLAWPSCSDGTKSGVDLPKKQSVRGRQVEVFGLLFFQKKNSNVGNPGACMEYPLYSIGIHFFSGRVCVRLPVSACPVCAVCVTSGQSTFDHMDGRTTAMTSGRRREEKNTRPPGHRGHVCDDARYNIMHVMCCMKSSSINSSIVL